MTPSNPPLRLSGVDLSSRAATCPGCRMPIMFDVHELTADLLATTRDVMCAFCGTVTTLSRLAHRSYLVPGPRLEALTEARLALREPRPHD